jgi:hypothetical protein
MLILSYVIKRGIYKVVLSILGFIKGYLVDVALIVAVGMFSKALIKEFGNDRAEKISEAICTAMLWAEEKLGIGNGNEKFLLAWDKIKELLQAQGIKLKVDEIKAVEVQIKANIPQINAISYSSLPEEVKECRGVFCRKPDVTEAVDKLKSKYKEGSE